MNRRLLVSNQDVLELVLLEDFVVDVEDGAAGISEDVLDALFLQAPYDDLGACDGRGPGFRAVHFCADGQHFY
jgi:hypothetical protein